MKTSTMIFTALSISLLACSSALGNPAMLPTHPGYPMNNAIDPVTGLSLANDQGQATTNNQEALTNAAIIDDSHSTQHLLFNQNDERVVEKPGAGLLPKVEGPNITIDPPVKEGTKVSATPK